MSLDEKVLRNYREILGISEVQIKKKPLLLKEVILLVLATFSITLMVGFHKKLTGFFVATHSNLFYLTTVGFAIFLLFFILSLFGILFFTMKEIENEM